MWWGRFVVNVRGPRRKPAVPCLLLQRARLGSEGGHTDKRQQAGSPGASAPPSASQPRHPGAPTDEADAASQHKQPVEIANVHHLRGRTRAAKCRAVSSSGGPQRRPPGHLCQTQHRRGQAVPLLPRRLVLLTSCTSAGVNMPTAARGRWRILRGVVANAAKQALMTTRAGGQGHHASVDGSTVNERV